LVLCRIEVTFDIDANGIVHVSAKDKATGEFTPDFVDTSSVCSWQRVQQVQRGADQMNLREAAAAHEVALTPGIGRAHPCSTMHMLVSPSFCYPAGKEQSIRIQSSGGLSEEQIQVSEKDLMELEV
jgi:molecular chaperone DnaK (HSP70)